MGIVDTTMPEITRILFEEVMYGVYNDIDWRSVYSPVRTKIMPTYRRPITTGRHCHKSLKEEI